MSNIQEIIPLIKYDCDTIDSNGDWCGWQCIEDNTPHAESTVLFKDKVQDDCNTSKKSC